MEKNKTRDVRFNACLGFTQEEVESVLKESLGNNIDIKKEIPVLKKYYNGYLFSEEAKNKIFNSDMVLYYASEYSINNAPPKQLIDVNISSDYKKMANLFALKSRAQNLDILKNIVEGISQKILITAEFSLSKNFTRDDFCSLLFYLGFLTIDSYDFIDVDLVVPNYVIKELYFDFFGEVLSEEAQYNIDAHEIRDSIRKIAKAGDTKSFIQIVTTTLKNLSNRDFIQFDEKYIKIIMITYFMMSRIYYVKSELEVDNGYIDIALLPRTAVKAPHYAVFEIKYIKKQAFSQEALNIKIEEAKEQILRYTTAEELSKIPNLLKYVLIFCGNELVYEERI